MEEHHEATLSFSPEEKVLTMQELADRLHVSVQTISRWSHTEKLPPHGVRGKAFVWRTCDIDGLKMPPVLRRDMGLLTLQEVSKKLCIHRKTISRWSREGKFPACEKYGNISMWRVDDIKEWASSVNFCLGEEVLTTQELADRYHVSRKTIAKWSREGKLPPHGVRGQSFVWRADDIETWEPASILWLDKEVYTAKDLASKFHVDYLTIMKWSREGKLPPHGVRGQSFIWRVKDIEDFIVRIKKLKREYISTREVCARCDIPEYKLHELVKCGEFPKPMKGVKSGRLFWRESDIRGYYKEYIPGE